MLESVTRVNFRHLAALRTAALIAFVIVHLCWGHVAFAGDGAIRDSVYALDTSAAGDVWAVGAFGSIHRSSDGGKSWNEQPSGTTQNLFGIDMLDASAGWIVGRSGTILKTTDGGEHWVAQPSGSERHLFDVVALDAQRVVAIGDWGTILTTDDGGAHWQDHTLPRDVILNAQSWVDRDHGWIVGEGGAIVRTSDGGKTWEEIDGGIFKTLYGVHFNDERQGWACGLDGLIVGSSDGGRTWATLHGEADLGGLEQVGARAGANNPHLYAIDVDGQQGLAVGDNSSVFSSSDGGRTWSVVNVPAAADLRWLRTVKIANRGLGYAAGGNGLIVAIDGSKVTLLSD